MAFDRRGERHTCTRCGTKWWDMNRPGAECPHCQPKPAPTKPTITIELEEEPTMPGEPNPKADERREKIRSLLSERPMKMGEIIEATGGVPMTVRADLRWIGATQQGNRLSPWALPETPADAPAEKPAEEDEVVAEEVSAQSNATLVACVYEAKRRVAQLPELERLREALAS